MGSMEFLIFFFEQMKKVARSTDFEIAIQWLLDCGLIYKVSRVNESHMPLKAPFYLSSCLLPFVT